jgi:hypothetical protein
VLALAALAIAVAPGPAAGQVLEAPFDTDYSVADLGAPPAVPSPLGGLTLKAGTTDRLLIGGGANGAMGGLYEVGLVRDPATRRITGFAAGAATRFADAPFVDGGVGYGPGGVLFYARYNNALGNEIGQVEPGSATTDKVVDLEPAGVAHSPGSLAFVPAVFAGAGSLKLASYPGGEWYDAALTPDGSGTFDLQGVTQVAASTVPGGPEGIVYVAAGSPQFTANSLLLSEYDAGAVGAYEIGPDGDPVVATRRTFVKGLTGAEGAFIDPVTGDFLFSTFQGGNRVIVVRGFAAPSAPTGTLTVIKRVVNDNGGGAGPGDWAVHVRSNGADVTGSPAPGTDAPGVTRTLAPGSYAVGVSGGPAGYTTSFSGDCDGSGRVSLPAGGGRTCTITSDDVPPPPPPPPPGPEFVPDVPPPSDTFGNTGLGYWKVPGSRTSVVIHVIKQQLVGGRLPAPVWGWTPDKTGSVFRPGGCYRQVGRLLWVIGFGGGGAFRRYLPGTNCRRTDIYTSRWFLDGPNGLRQNYLTNIRGVVNPTGRQVVLRWERVRPLLELARPQYDDERERFTIEFRTWAHHAHGVELRRAGRVIGRESVPGRDGRWVVRLAAPVRDGRYEVRLKARRGLVAVTRTARFRMTSSGRLRFP